jgi:hypothetical protein
MTPPDTLGCSVAACDFCHGGGAKAVIDQQHVSEIARKN